jgi:hypothetical protein
MLRFKKALGWEILDSRRTLEWIKDSLRMEIVRSRLNANQAYVSAIGDQQWGYASDTQTYFDSFHLSVSLSTY